MLSRIEIRNFAIIQSLDLDWSSGMTVVTGETGAGKSIVIDALGLTLGERAEQTVIYPDAKQAEVTAIFDLDEDSAAAQWLVEQELAEDEACILRRVVIRDGKSKCFINGRSVTQSQLKGIGSLLVDIHGQHAHQTLLKPAEQLNLLDRYAAHRPLELAVREASQKIKLINKRKLELEQEKQARDAKYDLLSYQVEELSQADPQQSVLDSLEQEHREVATSQDRLVLVESSLQWLNGEEAESSTLSSLAKIIESMNRLAKLDPKANEILEVLLQAESLLQDTQAELDSYRDHLDCDPEKLQMLDDQLSTFHDLARKHHVSLKQLPQHYADLQHEINQLDADESELKQIEGAFKLAASNYHTVAAKLTASRQKTAQQLQTMITSKIQGLAMQGGRIEIQLTPMENQYSSIGAELVQFLVSANPGQPLQLMNKVASGGELSRISLAIAVITAEHQLVPTIIFDEVDVGIGGGTAEVVGKLLNQLSDQRQVICVTHQPQVAACGKQHLVASKFKQINSTSTRVELLTQAQRIEEIGRMLGGLVISETTLSHAREMLGVD